jgi:predicted porin
MPTALETALRPALLAGLAACCLTAHAQSTVTVSGSLDTGVYRDTSDDWNVGSIQPSHLQFSGSEDLGSGVSAVFNLRTRMEMGTGAVEGNGSKPFWHGESTVGLKSATWGLLRFGRALDATQNEDWAFDPWENYDRVASPAWDLWHWNYSADPHGGGSGRVANGVFYDSPSLSGFSLHVTGSPETVDGDKTKTRAASVVYESTMFKAMVSNGRNSANDTETSVGLRGNFSTLSLMGLYNFSKTDAGSRAKVWTMGAMYGLGATTLKAGWGRGDVDGAIVERLFSGGVSYALSKRTTVYAELADKKLVDTGHKTVYGAGMTHSF